jgi:16S rRNA G966 N2-methylase RsmD/DNA-directed RNA polymerase subunit RPC12/RpoP
VKSIVSSGDEVQVRRTDPVYNAHGYLTKVPIAAILPFLESYSRPGDVVLDVFAGSGMTGVAAALAGRRAILVDISQLGHHVGTNYLNFVPHEALESAAEQALTRADESLDHPYSTACRRCESAGVLSRAVWSVVYRCSQCGADVVYHAAMAPDGRGEVSCEACGDALKRRTAKRVGEVRTLDVIACACSTKLLEQEPSNQKVFEMPPWIVYPDLPIDEDREMYRRSALARSGLTSTAQFFSARNLACLAALHQAIGAVEDEALQRKLLFVFTAILPRASKRYQWGPKRPLNAQNQTYYVAPVFLEWNVFDLYRRKLRAVERSDEYILGAVGPLFAQEVSVRYVVGSADNISFLEDESVDFIFTDPPFGSNLFYSDMSLFQEAWLGTTTDRQREAVIPTGGDRQSANARYGAILEGALQECYRVLKPGKQFSLVFSNSSGEVWALVQRAIHAAGFALEEDGVTMLDKGQRSVKGLASGYEGVVTTDLVLTMTKPKERANPEVLQPIESIEQSVAAVLGDADVSTPSRLYLRVVRRYLTRHWDLSELGFGRVLKAAANAGLVVDARSGRFNRGRAAIAR